MSQKPNLTEVLKNRDSYRIEWQDPWVGLDKRKHNVNAHVTHSASVGDCINIARTAHPDGTELGLLHNFIVVNWAVIVPHFTLRPNT